VACMGATTGAATVIHRPIAAAMAALTCTLVAIIGWAAPAAGDPAPTVARAASTASDGSEDVATCLQSARSLSALFLFDQSGSLSGSDPSGIRYDGLKVALQSLSRVNRPMDQTSPTLPSRSLSLHLTTTSTRHATS
jgi:hypothetical protein